MNDMFLSYKLNLCFFCVLTEVLASPAIISSLPSFHGCVRKLNLNGRPAVLSKPLSITGAVGIQGCPAI